ncbi:MAG TPA: PBP1A family penicillin-binding protein [Thermoanaerobaculia bacterium]|nr:PBP1A family penicillin-binding protein [Thermoanaerobaculia bacterium]
MRTRSTLGVLILVLFIVFTALFVAAAGWFGFRVFSELAPGSWRTPTEIVSRDGDTILALYGSAWRVTEPVVLEDLPDHVTHAFLAAEDVRFRSHPGIDPIGIGRAALTNVRSGGIAQGGSTITQQLAKTRFLSAERTFSRKAIEALLALLIELRLSKDEILEAYLNDVYLGHWNGRAVLGIDEAARLYFDKKPEELEISEASMLAGMVRAPNRDNAEDRPEVAKERRDAVIGVMLEREWISQEDHDGAVGVPVGFRDGSLPTSPHPYYLAALRAELTDRVGERRLRRGGMKIVTAFDRTMQRAAEEAVSRGVTRLRGRYSWLRQGEQPLQAALLSIDPATGGVRALVGGASFETSQFDRTRRMRRQPGSALKPFTYAAAIAGGAITSASVVEDAPVEIRLARNDIWRPENYDQRHRGDVTVREAFEKSLNTPAVRIAESTGVKRIRNLLETVQIEGDLSPTPAIALGVDEVSMRELVGAYTIFPNLGRRAEPHLIDEVRTASGRSIYRYRAPRRFFRSGHALDPAVAYVVHSLLRGVVQRGTAASLQGEGLGHIAGKTGTTNDYRDAWFVGYAPDLLTAAWVGFDDGTPLRISSAEAALPVWSAFMKEARHTRDQIAPPDGVSIVGIQRSSGLLWEPGCGERFDEVFLQGSEPTDSCRGRAERPPLVADFEEPPVISEDRFSELAREAPGVEGIVIVIDPGSMPPDGEPDVLSPEERASIDRQLEEALRRSEREDDQRGEEQREPGQGRDDREQPSEPEQPDSSDALRRAEDRAREEAERAREKALREIERQRPQGGKDRDEPQRGKGGKGDDPNQD